METQKMPSRICTQVSVMHSVRSRLRLRPPPGAGSTASGAPGVWHPGSLLPAAPCLHAAAFARTAQSVNRRAGASVSVCAAVSSALTLGATDKLAQLAAQTPEERCTRPGRPVGQMSLPPRSGLRSRAHVRTERSSSVLAFKDEGVQAGTPSQALLLGRVLAGPLNFF